MLCDPVDKSRYEQPHDKTNKMACAPSIHVILAWNEIGRYAIFGREIGVQDREVFSWRKK